MTLAGREHDDAQGDVAWAIAKSKSKLLHRVLGVLLRKILRQCMQSVTVDMPSFQRALAGKERDVFLVLAPSHRSYFDFLLLNYLCLEHAELGIPMPHNAAAEEFSRIPIVGRVLSGAQAFYVRRGVGVPTPELRLELERRVTSGSLMFFIEGQRSRARQALRPKRGLLRALQTTGKRFVVLPLAISYERIPEEAAFHRELSGEPRSRMSLRALLAWALQVARGHVSLGRAHISCGRPQYMDGATDVSKLAELVVMEQQRSSVITSFHVRAFIGRCQLPGVDQRWLASAIEERGGRVLESDTPVPPDMSLTLERSLQQQWAHWFYPEALALFAEDQAIRDYLNRQVWSRPGQLNEAPSDRRLVELCRSLFSPVAANYELVAVRVKTQLPGTSFSAATIVREHPSAFLPDVEDAVRALSGQGTLLEVGAGEYRSGLPRS